MRYGKANKLLLSCAQATFGTPLIVHNYSRLEDYFKGIWYRKVCGVRDAWPLDGG